MLNDHYEPEPKATEFSSLKYRLSEQNWRYIPSNQKTNEKNA